MRKCKTCKPIINPVQIVCPQPAVCVDAIACSEIIDAACIQYTGENLLLCSTTYSVVNTYDSLESILVALVAAYCDVPPRCKLKINFAASEGSYPSVSASITDGVGPYTYEWGLEQGNFLGHNIKGSSTQSTIDLECIGENAIETGTFNKYIKISHLALKVTDSMGCSTIEYFVYTSDCYVQIVDAPQPRFPFVGGRIFKNNGYETPFALTPMDFMDNLRYMPTCDELKNMCCVECYVEGEEANSTFRMARDIYFRNLNENILDENVGSIYPDKPLDYSPYETGGLGDKTVFHKGGLMNYNILWGCPECTFRIWTEIKWPQLNNQTLAQRFSMLNPQNCTKFYWLDSVPFGSTPPTGQPGQMVKWATNPLNHTYYDEYAWDPVTNSWRGDLALLLGLHIGNKNRQKRDAYLKALTELILANSPFLYANDYGLFHRYKYELKP